MEASVFEPLHAAPDPSVFVGAGYDEPPSPQEDSVVMDDDMDVRAPSAAKSSLSFTPGLILLPFLLTPQ